MSMTYTPLTELDAVNIMLSHIGELPVTTLTGSFPDVQNAQAILHKTSRDVQSRGFHCNSEDEFLFVRDVNGRIPMPGNTLKIDGFYADDDLVYRNNYLYDRENHTDVFDEDKYVNIVWFLPFHDLPESLRRYITIKAARIFQTNYLGSDTLHKLSENEEREAYLEVFREEVDSVDASIFDSYSTQKLLMRRM